MTDLSTATGYYHGYVEHEPRFGSAVWVTRADGSESVYATGPWIDEVVELLTAAGVPEVDQV